MGSGVASGIPEGVLLGRTVAGAAEVAGGDGCTIPGGVAGEVVGLAASVCHAHDALPRAVYQKYLPQLQELMRRGAAVEGPLPDNQRFNVQPSLPAPKALKSE